MATRSKNGNARIDFYYNEEGTCVIASRDAGGTLHEWGTCESRGQVCKCTPKENDK